MTAGDLVTARDLPPSARVDRRDLKSLLIERRLNGSGRATDQRRHRAFALGRGKREVQTS